MLLAVSKQLNTHMNFDHTFSYLFEKCPDIVLTCPKIQK
jgi:hypothetical protein